MGAETPPPAFTFEATPVPKTKPTSTKTATPTATKTTTSADPTATINRPPTRQTPDPDSIIGWQVVAIASSFVVPLIMLTILIFYFDRSGDPKFQINSVAISPFNVTGGGGQTMTQMGLTPGFDVNFTVRSPNENIDVVYDNIVVSLYYKKERILVGVLAPFHQEPYEEKKVRVRVSTALLGFLDNWVASSLAAGSPCGATVGLGVRMDGRVRYGPGTLSERNRGLKVSCENLKTEFLSADSEDGVVMVGEPVDCRVVVVKDL